MQKHFTNPAIIYEKYTQFQLIFQTVPNHKIINLLKNKNSKPIQQKSECREGRIIIYKLCKKSNPKHKYYSNVITLNLMSQFQGIKMSNV